MEDFFGALAGLVALACLPCGFLIARRCVKNVFGRIALTLVFGLVILIAGWIAVVSGCSALGGRVNFQ